MPYKNIARLTEEVFERPDGLIEFTLERVKTIIGNLRRPGGREVGDFNPGYTTLTSSFKFGVKESL